MKNSKSRAISLSAFIVSLLLLLSAAPALHAATATWVGNSSVNWADTLNWSGNQPTNNAPTFGTAGTAGTTLNNNLTANTTITGMTFSSGASSYTLNGNLINLTGTITNSSTTTETLNFNINGTGSVSTTGSGSTTILAGTNGFSGGVTAGSGTKIYINSATALGSGTFTPNGGSSFDNTSGSAIVLTNTNNITSGASNAFSFLGTNSLSFGHNSVQLGGATGSTLSVAGSGTLTVGSLSKANSGVLTIQGGGIVGILDAAGANIASVSIAAGTVQVGNATALGSGNLTFTGSSALQAINGPVTLSNNITIQAGVISTISGANSLTINGTVSGGVNDTSGINSSITGAGNFLTLAGQVNLTTPAASHYFNFSGTGNTLISGNITNSSDNTGTGNFNVTNTGITTLSGTNTYTGVTLANAAGVTLQFAKTVSLYNGNTANWTNSKINAVNGSTLAFNVGGTGEFSTGNVTTLLTNLTGGGIAAGSNLGFDTTNASGGNFVISDVIGGSRGLTKLGTNTLILTGNNTYSGVTSIQTGILSFATGNASASATQSLGTNSTVNIGVAGTSSGTLLYTGGAGVLAKNINALGNGQNTVQNSGSGLLTLTGGLSKNGTILVLKGGSNGIAVNGTISGSAANSDLYIDGGTTTLNAANTYNGPTLVYNGGTLALGINNAIPTASAVTLGDATTSGTLAMGSFTNSIASLSFGAGNGTLKMAANQTGSAQLAASGAVALGTGNTLDLTGMGTSAGVYKLVSGSSLNGTFSTTTGLDSAYLLRYGTLTANELDAQHKATIGTITGTPAAVSIITGGSTSVTANVSNSAPTGSTSLAFTATAGTNMSGSATGNATAGTSANSGSGLSFTGTTVGASQNGTFNVTAAETTNSGQTGTVTVNVYDHASGSVGNSTLALGNIHAGYASPVTSSSVSATNASGYRVDLTGSAAAIGNISLNTLAATAAGSSNAITATLATGQTAGAISQAFTYTFADSSSLSGASSNLGNVTLTVTGGVYNLASANTITTPVLLKTRVGGNFTSSALTITNTADAGSFTEHLDASGSASGNATTSGSISGLAGGSTNNSTLLVGMTADTSTSGNKTGGTVTVALTSNGTGTSGLGNTVINPQDILVSGVVYDYADPLYSKTGGSGTFTPVNSTTYTLNFGTGLALNTTYTANINLANGGSINLFQDALGGAYSYSGDSAFANTASNFSWLASGSSNTFNISFNTGSLGTFTGTLTLAGLSQQSGLDDAGLGNFTINILGATTAVPEPSAWAAMFVGVSTFLFLRRRRKNQI